jgi:hypothetical protein
LGLSERPNLPEGISNNLPEGISNNLPEVLNLREVEGCKGARVGRVLWVRPLFL